MWLCAIRRRTFKTLQLQALQLNSFHLSPSMAASGRSLLRKWARGALCILKSNSSHSVKKKTCSNWCDSGGTGLWRLERWLQGCFPCQFVLMSRQESAAWCSHWKHRDAKVCACAHVCVCASPSLGHHQRRIQPSDKLSAAGRCVSRAWVSASLPWPCCADAWTCFTHPHAVKSWQEVAALH